MQNSIITLHTGIVALIFNSELDLSITVEYTWYYFSFLTASETLRFK